MRTIRNSIIFAASILLINGCKKDKDRLNDLTKDIWKLSSIRLLGKEGMLDCQKDNTLQFLTDHSSTDRTFFYRIGTDNCNGGDQNQSGDWQLIDGDSKIILNGLDTVQILTLDAETLRYSRAPYGIFGVWTFTH